MKHLREITAYAVSLGIADAHIERRGRHPHLVGTTPAGDSVRYVVPGSPSDSARGERNARAGLRRMVCRPRQKMRPTIKRSRSARRRAPTVLDPADLRAEFASFMEGRR